MDLLDELKDLGADVDEALKLLSGNASLYEKLLGTFVNLVRELDIRPDFDSNDYAEVLENAHKLKGAAGNLALTPLYQAYSEIVRLLRENKPEEAKEVLTDILPSQERIIHCIENNR